MATKLITHITKKLHKILPNSKKKLKEFYDVTDQKLGSGNYSIVKLGIHKISGESVALKIIDKNVLKDIDKEIIATEIEILQKYGNHTNIVCLKDVFEDRKTITLVMELLNGGSLLSRLQKVKYYSEKDAIDLAKSLFSAIAYLHNQGVVHRDLKPENLMFTEDSVLKIGDFGFALHIGDKMVDTPCGSPIYVAPEIVRQEEYNLAVDIWSAGVIVYVMLCGFPPFYHETKEKIFAQIEQGRFDFPDPYWTKISKNAKDFVTRCLTVAYKKRMTAVEALQHPWLNK